MKYLVFTLTCIMLLQAAVLGAVNYVVPLAATPPVIDGDLTTGWAGALSIPMVDPDIVTSPKEGTIYISSPDDAADLSADVYLQWDADNLYVAARVYDETLEFLVEGPAFNAQDVFQMAFNLLDNPNAVYLDNAPMYDLAAENSLGEGPFLYKHDPGVYELPNAEIGAQVLADGYTVELKAPWSDFDYTPANGDVHGIGFVVLDFDGGSLQTLMMDYGQGIIGNIGVPTAWNTMTLVGESDCGLWGLADADFNADCRVDFEDFAYMADRWLDCTDPDVAGCVNMR